MSATSSTGGGADRRRPTAIVAIGASAGGVEAFRALVGALPADGGIAYVVLSHLSPSHPSLLPQILARETTLPVASARDDLRVEPDHVYLLPPGAFLEIENGVLRLEPYDERREVRTPIDRFFASLARDAERRAVGIVLSGSGSDGALGVVAIRDAGGLTIAQKPETAGHEGMPRSAIAGGAIDLVLEVAEIPARLAEHVRQLEMLGPATASPDFQEQVGNILGDVHEIVRRRTGHDMSRYKEGTIVRRVIRRMQVHHLRSAGAYVDLLRRDPAEVDRLFGELLIGVTSFFRDPEAFDFLARETIPKLFEGKSTEDPFRLWVPACSGGEETYSLAILLAEEVARRPRDSRVQIFASDIHPGAIENARRAVYPEGIAEQVSPERLERFFLRDGDGYRVRKEIREMCVFSSHSLIRHPPFSRLDLISCRNLMIYLKSDLQEKIATLFHYALRPGGVLFLGSSEHPADGGELFRPVHRRFRLFERADVDAPSLPDLPVARLAIPSARHLPPQGGREESGGQRIARALERALLAEYTPPCVVVDANGRAVYFSGSIGRYLEPAAGVASHDLLEMARGSLRLDLRAALHQATTAKKPVVRDPLVVDTALGRTAVRLAVRPLGEPAAGDELWMITFEELKRSERPADEPAGEPAPREAALVTELESELRDTKEQLHRVIVDLESANAELKSANEELLSMNEELQSTNEELETSKEELQSVNEELETLNVELLRKVDELDAARSDAQNLFDSTRIATLFLDERLRIKRFTPATEELFRLIPSDVGRPLADLVARFHGADLSSILEQVQAGAEPVEREVWVAETGAAYLARVLPYRVEGRPRGVILTFVDVTRLRRAQRNEARLAAIDESQDAIFAATLDGRIADWNHGAANVYGWTADGISGKPLGLLFPEEHRAEAGGALERVRRGEPVEPLELVNLRADGSRIDVVLGLSPIRDAGGRIVAISAIARDVTMRRREQQRLEEEGRRKDTFLAVLGHEIRNPLSAIRNAIHVMRRAGTGTETAETARAVIDRQSAQLARLVDDLLDLSRISTGRIVYHAKRFDLATTVRDTVEDQRIQIENCGVALELELPLEPLEVNADSSRIAEAVGNLLENARKFTKEGGRIGVRIARSEDGESAVVVVADDGLGMAPETIPQLFEPFPHVSGENPRGKPGLGLGLALVKALIEDQGGSVTARSAGLDRGSEFVIRLPLAEPGPPAEDESRENANAAEAAPPRRILLVEDEPDAAESLKLMLELSGHRVTLVGDGAGAIAAATADPPEVLLCDIGLPGEHDGYAVAAALRGEPDLRSAFFVALTGFGRAPDRERALDAGFDVHLTKPVDPAELERLLCAGRGSPTSSRP